MRILLVGAADTIFITNYVKSLKNHMDVEVHVYSPFTRLGNYENYPYDYVHFEDDIVFKSKLMKKIGFLFWPFIQRKRFSTFLKIHNTQFDIIHFHRIIPAWTLRPREYKKYCKKLMLTFWGGELDVENLLTSRKLYKCRLKRLIELSDKVINTFSDSRYFKLFPDIKAKAIFGQYGSSIIDEMQNVDPANAKEMLGIPNGSVTILLGYSGKRIHNHFEILRRIISDVKFEQFKDLMFFILPMTRGGSEQYAKEIQLECERAGVKYLLIKDNYFSDRQVAELRMATDFVFQLSDFDGLSSSIKECLCAGSIVIMGGWLPYSPLRDIGFMYPEVQDVDEGVSVFYQLLESYPLSKQTYALNKETGKDQYSWDKCIIDWVSAYNQI